MDKWKVYTPYNKGTMIENENGQAFLCIQSHTSQAEFQKRFWRKWKPAKVIQQAEEWDTGMDIKAITSMSEEYYEHCGRVMLRSWKKNWSRVVPIYVYNEKNFRVKVTGALTKGWNLGNDFLAFQRRHQNSKVKTFAKKAYPIIDAMENLDCDRLMWLDADSVMLKAPPKPFFSLICPDDVLSAHFEVWHSWPSESDPDRMAHSCETGFFILNKRHPGFEFFKETYKRIYNTDDVQDIRRFYDGEVYGKTVQLCKEKGYKMMDLNPGKHKTPISRSIIAPYLAHYKAGLKDSIDFDSLLAEIEDSPDDEV